MKNLNFVLSALLAFGSISCATGFSSVAKAIDIDLVEKELTTSGATGWIHGAVDQQGIYVFTYRNPTNFFDYIQMSLVAADDVIQAQLEKLNRHDKVRIKGKFLKNPSPQKHIKVTSIEVLTKYESTFPSEEYDYNAKIPDELVNVSEALFLVHAIGGEGQILVVEYKDAIVPIFVRNKELTKNLFRNDLVRLKIKIRIEPDRPTHLALQENDPEPVKVIESILSLHEKPASVEGALILFPKSPEISLNVFAVEQDLPEGLKRQFTLVNFDDQEVFKQILAKLQSAWDRHPGEYVNGRNKLVSKKIRVRANGIFNEVSASQANAQILLKSVDDIIVIE